MAGKTEPKTKLSSDFSLNDLIDDETTGSGQTADEIVEENFSVNETQEAEGAFTTVDEPETVVEAPKRTRRSKLAVTEQALAENTAQDALVEAVKRLTATIDTRSAEIAVCLSKMLILLEKRVNIEPQEKKPGSDGDTTKKLSPYDASVQKMKEKEAAKAEVKTAPAAKAEVKPAAPAAAKPAAPAVSYEQVVVELDRILKGQTPAGPVKLVEFGQKKCAEILRAIGSEKFSLIPKANLGKVLTMLKEIK